MLAIEPVAVAATIHIRGGAVVAGAGAEAGAAVRETTEKNDRVIPHTVETALQGAGRETRTGTEAGTVIAIGVAAIAAAVTTEEEAVAAVAAVTRLSC